VSRRAQSARVLTPYRPIDEGGWPASPEVRLELVRRRLWDMSQAGSAVAMVALERALARERAHSAPAEDDPFREVDELRDRREAQRQVGPLAHFRDVTLDDERVERGPHVLGRSRDVFDHVVSANRVGGVRRGRFEPDRHSFHQPGWLPGARLVGRFRLSEVPGVRPNRPPA
jgi:hypothetical protein